MINSYPSVYAIGHKAIQEIFQDDVVVEEKMDGSQFSFGIIDGELECRSKGKQIILSAPEKMFGKAIDVIENLAKYLNPNWVYRCEYLEKPKHNTLAYSRIPDQHLMIYDINMGLEEYMPYDLKKSYATALGLETVPLLYSGKVESFEMFKDFLDGESILGGVKVEGVVVKNYKRFSPDKKAMMGKYVSEAFKEKHEKEWGAANPSGKDIAQQLIETYRTEARWQKAIQHLREAGQLEDSPRDIGLIIREVSQDILKEEESAIKDVLFNHFSKQLNRGVTAGIADWYKEQLAKTAFEVSE